MATSGVQPASWRTWKSTKPETRREYLLAGFALLLTGVSPNLLALDLKFGVPMSTTAPVLLLFTLGTLAAVFLYAREKGHRQIATLLITGILLGATSTAAYDAFRLGGHAAGFIEHDEARDFGEMILGTQTVASPPASSTSDHAGGHGATSSSTESAAEHSDHPGGSSWITKLVGYLYHYWNGGMFGLAYLILFGLTRWWGPVLWMTLFVYSGMVIVMGVHSWADFAIEAAGHAAYGAVFGLLIQRWYSGAGVLRFIIPVKEVAA